MDYEQYQQLNQLLTEINTHLAYLVEDAKRRRQIEEAELEATARTRKWLE